MRKLLIFLFVALTVVLSVSARKPAGDGKAMAKFDEQVYNFGAVKEKGGPVSHNFNFVNIGNGNLVILDARAECGCTRPEYPDKPVAPGKKGKVKVTFNPIGRRGTFEKVVTLRTNGRPGKVRLKIRGTVVP